MNVTTSTTVPGCGFASLQGFYGVYAEVFANLAKREQEAWEARERECGTEERGRDGGKPTGSREGGGSE